jgi:hypothetical protein
VHPRPGPKHQQSNPSRFRSWIRQISPYVVEVAVSGCARGIVARATEKPELIVAVNPVRPVAAATRTPEIVGLKWDGLVSVDTVLATGVRALEDVWCLIVHRARPR